MAHNINYANGKHAFFSRKEIPWHKLGQVVDNALTSEQAIREAGLDYDVVKCPVFADLSDISALNTHGTLKDYHATVRADTLDVLGLVGSRYEVVQNTQAFDFIDQIVGTKEAIFETAGALGKGETIFITAKLPNNIRVKATDDVIDNYILFTSSHDGSGSIVATFTPVRVVCNNTLNMALHTARNKVTFRHTKNVHGRMADGLELLGLYRAYSLEFSEQLNALANRSITDSILGPEQLIHQIVFTKDERVLIGEQGIHAEGISSRKRNTVGEMLTYMDYGAGQELHRGTPLWLYNGISTYYNNGKKYKTDEDRFNNLSTGTPQKNTQKAFDLVTDLYL